MRKSYLIQIMVQAMPSIMTVFVSMEVDEDLAAIVFMKPWDRNNTNGQRKETRVLYSNLNGSAKTL